MKRTIVAVNNMSTDRRFNTGQIITLERLHLIDKLTQYSSYLKDEWISTKKIFGRQSASIKMEGIKLPARLKLERRKVVEKEGEPL